MDFIKNDLIRNSAEALIILVFGWIILRLFLIIIEKIIKKKFPIQTSILIKKIIFYTGWIIIIMGILNTLGIKLSVVLGAAGIVGIALGFAAQTSVANIISGVFLISEKSFTIGDIIQIDDITGVVDSIDLLSIKIKKFNNQYVRIPNEKIIKSNLINITKYPIRRLDLNLGIAYKEDPEKVKSILLDIAKKNEYVLDNPEPVFAFNNFGNRSLELFFGVWFQTQEYIPTKNSIMFDIKKRFDKEEIEIPFPHVTVYKGSESEPFQIENIDSES